MSQYLGQHFLKNTGAIAKIVAALDLKKGETVIEIGPGKGALTIPLAQKCAEVGAKLIAIEKDSEMVKGLRSNVKDRLEIITGDVLTELPTILNSNLSLLNFNLKPYKLVGNIPYYITGNLLRVISELPVKPELIVLMVQKEVAQRVAAKPPKMNLLAAATQAWADVKIIFTLPASDFEPAPEVESGVIKIATRVLPIANSALETYYNFIHKAFKQPRKTLLNNLCENSKNKQEILLKLQKNGFNEKTRAQELNITQLIKLSATLLR